MGNCTGGGGGQQKRAMDAKGGTLGNGDPRSIRSPMVAFARDPAQPYPDAQSMMLTASSIFIFPQLDEQKEEQWKVRRQ